MYILIFIRKVYVVLHALSLLGGFLIFGVYLFCGRWREELKRESWTYNLGSELNAGMRKISPVSLNVWATIYKYKETELTQKICKTCLYSNWIKSPDDQTRSEHINFEMFHVHVGRLFCLYRWILASHLQFVLSCGC